MAAAILTLALAFLCGGGLWLGLGPRLTLSEEQMAAIDALDSADGRMGPDPIDFC